MGTIVEKLNYLSVTKQRIKAAIAEKGVTVPSDATFRSYSEYIRSIDTTGGSGGSSGGDIVDPDDPTVDPDDPEKPIMLTSVSIVPTGEDMVITPESEGLDEYAGFDSVSVAGEPNLQPYNIAEGCSIYGVVGTFQGINGSDIIGSGAYKSHDNYMTILDSNIMVYGPKEAIIEEEPSIPD